MQIRDFGDDVDWQLKKEAGNDFENDAFGLLLTFIMQQKIKKKRRNKELKMYLVKC